jgi:hypothetical protein
MIQIKRRITTAGLGLLLVLGLLFVLSTSTGSVLAHHDNSNPQAAANCSEVIAKQDAKGQTGSNTGSANDKKQLPTAVTNCDHFWNAGPNP